MSITQLEPSSIASAPPARRAAFPWATASIAVAVVAAHLPLVVLHVRQIWMRPYYQFIPLLLPGAAVLAVLRLRGLGSVAPARPIRSVWLLGAAWLMLAAAELLYSSWLGAVAALAALAALLYAVGGARLVRAMLPAWLLLWLAVPPPFELDRQLVLRLQSLTSRWASSILDFLGLFHVLAGNVVEIGGRRLFVEEACSGVNSLFSALACTLFLVLLLRRPLVHALLLLTATVGWVLAANAARVAGIAYLLVRCGVDLSEGWRHEALGAGLFVVVLGLVWCTDRLLLFLMSPSAATPKAMNLSPPDAPVTTVHPWGSRAAAWTFTGLYCLLLIAHFALYGAPAADGPVVSGPVVAVVDGLDAESLPDHFERWQRTGYAPESRNPGSAFGERSKTWSYQAGANTAAFSVDYTFPSWHDLTRCYTGQGWTLDEQVVRKADAGGYVAVKLSKPGYRSGYLLFRQINPRGEPLEPRLGAAYLSLYRQEAAAHRWLRLVESGPAPAADPPGPVYQLQLFVESYSPLGAVGRADAEALFVSGVRSLRERWQENP